MKEKILRWFCAIALILAAVAGQLNTSMVVYAAKAEIYTEAGIADFEDGEAQITIYGNEGQSLVGKNFIIYRLLNVENSEDLESVNYTINAQYAVSLRNVVAEKLEKPVEEVTDYMIIDYMQSMNNYPVEGAHAEQTVESTESEYRYFVEELIQEMVSNGDPFQTIHVVDTKEDNSVDIVGLKYGYYLLTDITNVNGEHTAASLSMMNTANPEASVNVKSDYPAVTKKIQEDDSSAWNDMGDFEIGQNVPFQFQSTIPNINGYGGYYYAWHDVMDIALTLNKDSIQITITGMMGDTEKTYTLTSEEFALLTEVENETFVIEVEDIKAIIDREFDQIDDRNENVYGQTVTVSYTAALNDQAAEATGRPGFENDVRLEFSNDPNAWGEGITGFTPWDTVVCFTYQMNGGKINNNNETLEGAEFKLYRDETCENQVYVKLVDGKYYVMNEDSWSGTPSGAAAIVSDENGEFHVYGLDSGIYYLKETAAPDGYRQLMDPIKIEITSVLPEDRDNYVKGDASGEQILNLVAEAHIKTFTNGSYVEEDSVLGTDAEKGSFHISVVNEVGKKLPVTGSYAMPVLVGVGLLFMVTAVRRERKKHE